MCFITFSEESNSKIAFFIRVACYFSNKSGLIVLKAYEYPCFRIVMKMLLKNFLSKHWASLTIVSEYVGNQMVKHLQITPAPRTDI